MRSHARVPLGNSTATAVCPRRSTCSRTGTGVPAAFRRVQPPQGFPKGATWLVYERAGDPVTGVDMDRM